jgi:hypothetical protein
MAKNPKPVAEVVFGDETVVPVVETPDVVVETPDPKHPVPVVDESLSPEVVVVDHVAASEGEEFTDPEALPQLPYQITELGIQPVALASRTYASDFGPGGAAHKYRTVVDGQDGAIVASHEVKFQNGALGEGGGINGISDSTLLSILADRWTAFQSGPFASNETGEALRCVLEAAQWLNTRTAEREGRGVQGKHEA